MVIDNPRQDAAEVFEVLKNVLQGEIAKKQSEVLKNDWSHVQQPLDDEKVKRVNLNPYRGTCPYY